MIVYDLNSGRREYPGYDEIEDRRGEAEAEAGVLMGRTWGTVVVFTTITVCMRR